MPPPTTVLVLAGPAGSGKTTVGRTLAERLGWAFADADAFHSAAAVGKMGRGEALTDADRAPWLGRLAHRIARAQADGAPLVLACSALRAAHRARLRADGVVFVWLDVPPDVLARRLAARTGHFAGPDLLASQLATAEPQSDVTRVDATATPEQVAEAIRRAVGV